MASLQQRLPLAAALVFLSLLIAPDARGSRQRRTPIVDAIQSARPAIVNIQGRKTIRGSEDNLSSDTEFRQVNGMGTGVIVNPRGYIVTNYHVVEGVSRIQVTLDDRRVLLARLVAHDRQSDLAIIHVARGEPLPGIKIGRSDDLLIGETVIAVGNAFGYEHTATEGIISALHRTVQVSDEQKYRDLIQTDASINPGNSGGPLLNIDGDMIGINVAVRVGAQGIGFAIPIDEVLEIAARLIRADQSQPLIHGIHGKTVFEADKQRFVVTDVEDQSPAALAGLKMGDTITEVGGTDVQRLLDFERALVEHLPGDEIEMQVVRAGVSKTCALVLKRQATLGNQLVDQTWNRLGLQLSQIPDTDFRKMRTRYRGGLRVLAVRNASPAAEQGIRRGDILVGMHEWETTSLDNVAYILNREDLDEQKSLKFYILRGRETLYGFFEVARRP